MEVEIKKIYRHYKGDYYFVEDIATHSETGEKLVIYRALYGDCGLWARPYDMFLSELSPDKATAEQSHRFEKRDIKSVRK